MFQLTQAALLSLVCATILFITGCASSDAANQESMLSAAGFRVRIPQTPQQQDAFAALPSYKVQRASANGKISYVYKDKKEGIAYVGGEAEYQRYQQLAIQREIAEDYYQAAQLNNHASMGWHGAWGPSGFWW